MTDKQNKILVIEDNQGVLDGILNILDYCGYRARGVLRFSEEIFEEMKDGHYELVILDVMLSGCDGRDLARRFKSTKETEKVPLLMISAYSNIEPSVRAAGADDFLPKPFGVNELRKKVEQYL